MHKSTIFVIVMAPFFTACAQVPTDIYSVECEPTGKSAGSGSLMGLAINEPAKEVFWMGPLEKLYPIEVSRWDASAISGTYKIGTTSVLVDYDRLNETASFKRRAPDGLNLDIDTDSCDVASLEEKDKARVLRSSRSVKGEGSAP